MVKCNNFHLLLLTETDNYQFNFQSLIKQEHTSNKPVFLHKAVAKYTDLKSMQRLILQGLQEN